jgi:gliding motility-associated-like protein
MTVTVNSKIDPQFSNVPAICNGGIVPLLPNTSNNGITGNWSPSVINNITVGTYTFTPSVNECANTKSLVTVIIPNPYSNIRYPTVNAVQNQNYQLQARAFQNANYLWMPTSGLSSVSIINPVFNYNRQQQYNIKITTAEGCVINDTILVRMYQNCEIYVPRGFSPNGDGMNDVLLPELVGISQLKYFKVFDRWGQMMFQTNILGNGWDGRYKGAKQPIETYMWMAEGIDVNGNIIKKNGSTIIIR